MFACRPVASAGRSERMPPLTLSQETPHRPRPGTPRSPPASRLRTRAHRRLEGRLARTVIESLEDAKAEDIVSIDVTGKTTIADLMIIATGRSNVHVGRDRRSRCAGVPRGGFPAPRIEGVPHCDWVLLDAGDAIIHIFKPDVRQFYNLEKMWSADRPGEMPARPFELNGLATDGRRGRADEGRPGAGVARALREAGGCARGLRSDFLASDWREVDEGRARPCRGAARRRGPRDSRRRPEGRLAHGSRRARRRPDQRAMGGRNRPRRATVLFPPTPSRSAARTVSIRRCGQRRARSSVSAR